MFSDKSAVMIYLSDHGENVYDLGDYKGRRECDLKGDGIHYLLEVPFVVWCSDRYKAHHPNIIEKLECSKDKPMMTDNLSHLLMSLGGVISDYYKTDRDVLSSDYKCPRRIVQTGIDYDSQK